MDGVRLNLSGDALQCVAVMSKNNANENLHSDAQLCVASIRVFPTLPLWHCIISSA